MSGLSALRASGRFIVRITTFAVALDGAVLRGHRQGLGHGDSRSVGPDRVSGEDEASGSLVTGAVGYPRHQDRTCST